MKSEKSVDEIVEEFRNKSIAMQENYGIRSTPDYYDDELCDWLTQTLTAERQKREEVVETILKDFSKWADEKIEEQNDYDFEDGGDPEYRDRRNAIQNQKQSCYRQAKSHLQALTQPNNLN